MSLSDELCKKLSSNQFVDLLEQLKNSGLNQQKESSEESDLIAAVTAIFYRCTQLFYACENNTLLNDENQTSILDEIVFETCRILRNSCAGGAKIQNQIVSTKSNSKSTPVESNIFHAINVILRDLPKAEHAQAKISKHSQKMCWQFLANLSVQNQFTQQRIWDECMHDFLSSYLRCVCESGNARECTMILYNIFIGGCAQIEPKALLEFLLACNTNVDRTHDLEHNDFHQIFLEHFIISYRQIVPAYDKLLPDKRLALLYYIADHMKQVRHDPISLALLQFIAKEFKKKSDCVLKTVTSYLETIHPKEVIALLDIIAKASADERYAHVMATDGSLFLNVGCLLQTINAIGKRTATNEEDRNIFAPVQKLGQLAPNSSEECSIESDISYQLKSTLVRTLANLAYKNKKNQDLAREMDIMAAVLDSTNLDARNPLIKEWSILAIRNLCENNFENQQIIRQLTKVGDGIQSDILKEFNVDLGTLRINPN